MRPEQLEELAEDRRQREVAIYLSYFGECVVRADPGNSKALLAASPDSRDEGIAIAALGKSLSGCLEAGRTLELNKTNLRGTVALNYYRLAKAAQSSAPVVAGSPQPEGGG